MSICILAGAQFDAVMGLEIIEHVDQPQHFLKTLASLTKSDGALFISTINRTPRGYALAILGAEYIAGIVPKGTHDWNKFVTPGEHDLHACLPINQRRTFAMRHKPQ